MNLLATRFSSRAAYKGVGENIRMKETDSHFSAFYKDNCILVLFLIEEFICSFQLYTEIENLAQEKLQSLQCFITAAPHFIQLFSQLTGFLHPNEHSTQFSWTRGPLTKLKEICRQFNRNSSLQNKIHINLQIASHHAWLLATHNLELLNTHTDLSNSEQISFFASFKNELDDFKKKIHQIQLLVPQAVSSFWENENVVLCLLRRKELLEKIYGPDFLSRHFKWSMKIAELNELLIKRFQERGFDCINAGL